MAEEKLVAIQPKRFKPRTTDSRGTKDSSPNLLKSEADKGFSISEAIVGDITYLPMKGGGFCYLAMFQDKVSRRIVGWKLSERMTATLVVEALQMGLRRGYIKRGAIIHTDRGSQYASNEYRKLLRQHGLRQSMSGRGNCYDNAQAESFFSRYKTEIEVKTFAGLEEAQMMAFDYIECYYNRVRRHSSIGYKTPDEFENEAKQAERRSCGNAASDGNVENLKNRFPHISTAAWKSPRKNTAALPHPHNYYRC